MSSWKDSWSVYYPIFTLLIGGLILGYALVGDYGKSLDEDHLMVYGRQTIEIIRGERDSDDTIANLNYYGPVYSLMVELGRFKLAGLNPGWQDTEARHFSYFLTFLVALFFLYALCIRFVSRYAAIGATLLFASQPLLFGHAFINPKDIPFMALFTGSVAVGFHTADRLFGARQPEPAAPSSPPAQPGRGRWPGNIAILILAALFFGLCTNVRVFGLMAGGLVSVYAAAKGGLRSVWALALYWGIGLTVTYLTWPFLWESPFQNFLDSLEIMTNFPTVWAFYRGQSFAPSQLPWYYLPHLIGIQLTIPALLLGAFGLYRSYHRGGRSIIRSLDRHLIVLWLAMPILYFILARPHLYDNFRQLLFIVPPIFVLGSIGLSGIVESFPRSYVRHLLVLLILVPGLVALFRLHPYQYIYYNAAVGGVRGAFQEYPLDYWCTSSREAIEQVNSLAPPGAIVRFNKKRDLIMPFAREDLQIIGRYTASDGLSGTERADLTIACLRGPRVLKEPDQTILWQVERDGVPLAVISAWDE